MSGDEFPTMPRPSAPALVYVGTDGSNHVIDAEGYDRSQLPIRERAVCIALLNHALERLIDERSAWRVT